MWFSEATTRKMLLSLAIFALGLPARADPSNVQWVKEVS